MLCSQRREFQGIVIPNQKGEFFAGMSKRLGMVGFARQIEAEGDFKFAQDLGISYIMIEGDY